MKPEELTRPAVAISYVQLSLELGAERGIARESLLEDLGISEAQLAQADARVPFLQYGRLCARLLRLSGDPGLGYEFGLRSTLTLHGLLGYGVMAQGTVREALQFFIDFAPKVRSPGFGLRFVLDGDAAVVDLTETVQYGPLHQYAVDMQLVSGVAIMREGLADAEMELWFKCPEPEYYARYRHRLPPARFSMGANQIRFPAALLDRLRGTPNKATAQLVREYCERESALVGVGEDFVSRVRALLTNDDCRYPDLEAVAQRLCISTRTLKRRLHDHGFSFNRLLNEARQRDAIRLLKDTGLTVEQIAERLGYSDAANFTRAFRRLTGGVPSALRAPGRRRASAAR
ncbi:MAG TPA: AraC family transcriptional regulator [Solimonas sp.]|nr:AraC family transcriptional regulator [Solimonas sp.]